MSRVPSSTRKYVAYFGLGTLVPVLLLVVSCGPPAEARVESLAGSPEKLPYRFESLTGVRDADLLKARAVFAGGSGPLEMEMVFRIGVPTRLESGRYRWSRENRMEEGAITEVSATFLGGQSDRPSVGGVFLLHDQSGAPAARVILPTTQVARR